MRLNPYQPLQLTADGSPRNVRMSRVWLAMALVGLVALLVGIGWLRLLRRSAVSAEVSPVEVTCAEIVTCGGLAMAVIGLVIFVGAGAFRLYDRFVTPSLSGQAPAEFGWNTLPAVCAFLIGIIWIVLGTLGLYSMAITFANWDLRRDYLLESALETLLFSSAMVSGGYCFIAARQWMRRNSRSCFYTIVGVLGPIVSYVILFPGCRNLVEYLVVC